MRVVRSGPSNSGQSIGPLSLPGSEGLWQNWPDVNSGLIDNFAIVTVHFFASLEVYCLILEASGSASQHVQ